MFYCEFFNTLILFLSKFYQRHYFSNIIVIFIHFNKYFNYFIFFKFFRKLFYFFFYKIHVINKKFIFFKPIFKLNFFINLHNFKIKKLQYVNYKFYLNIKKTLFFYRRFNNFKRDMFYYIFRTKTRLKLKYLKKFTLIKFKTKYFKNKYFKKYTIKYRLKQFDLKKKYKQNLSKNREVLNYFVYFKKLKKYRNTKYIAQFKAKQPHDILTAFNYNIISILYFSTLFYSYYQILYFINNQFVYKNGVLVKTPMIVFKAGDRLNLIFSKNYYFYSIFLYFFFFKQLKKLNKHHWKFIRFRSNFYKQKPKKLNNFFEKYLPFYTSQPSCFELDYKTLTIILLFPSNKLNCLNDFYLRYINYYFFRLYNWKYII